MRVRGVLIRSLIILSQAECRGARHFLLSRVMQQAVLHVMNVYERVFWVYSGVMPDRPRSQVNPAPFKNTGAGSAYSALP
jgi:hypothetical protein